MAERASGIGRARGSGEGMRGLRLRRMHLRRRNSEGRHWSQNQRRPRRRPWRLGRDGEAPREGESCGRLGDCEEGSGGLLIATGRARGGGGEVAHGGRCVRASATVQSSAVVARAHGREWEGNEGDHDESERLTEMRGTRGREGAENRREEEDDGHGRTARPLAWLVEEANRGGAGSWRTTTMMRSSGDG